ncbi:TetR/AcrR family transcriptional regulator [Fodinicola feengrottensis]|nr:TetR/AcrR family transcriptional regulator [Fodinicola feengrottensis]
MAGVVRRTQAQRRAATRTALLDATLESLVEHGYANVTAAQIAARAGVTRGAQAHYFATKAELVTAALEHAADQITDKFRADPPICDSETKTVMALVDRLWDLHDSPTFVAIAELWLASRTDAELRPHVIRLDKRVTVAVTEILTSAAPGMMASPDATAVMLTALAVMRGVLLTSFVSSQRSVAALWATTRGELEKLIAVAADH